ncbi:uncharacterized protein METZ01_LOCUS197571 [marine metagenome]|uniref:Uncharacterized protein n=1 Tax=marine metagenome TaxID=408172 RepID=A0A382E4C2_9ZZZZ
MPYDNIYSLNNNYTFPRINPTHSALFIFIFSGNNLYNITFTYSHQTTSAARETIFINPFSRSSLATGPNILVPLGLSNLSVNITAALSSKRMCVPSERLCPLEVLTITAFTTVPLLTGDAGIASLTVPTITSPT